MAFWIRVVDGVSVSTEVTPKNGKSFELGEMNQFVGGYLEALQLFDGRVMWLNEEGKLNGLPYNHEANFIAHQLAEIAPGDHIVGNVLIATRAETGDDEEEE